MSDLFRDLFQYENWNHLMEFWWWKHMSAMCPVRGQSETVIRSDLVELAVYRELSSEGLQPMPEVYDGIDQAFA